MQDLRKEKKPVVFTGHIPTNYMTIVKKYLWIGIVALVIIVVVFPYEIGKIIGNWYDLFVTGFKSSLNTYGQK